MTFKTFDPPRIVIDTNVCLDLLLFRDVRWDPMMAALNEGRWTAVTRADCREEWLRVLRYPQFRVEEAQYTEMVAAFDGLSVTCDPIDPRNDTPLPVCRDPDDQKFLELAQDVGASVLVSKDKALLKLARRTRRAGLFEIMSPQAWVASYGGAPG